MISARYAIAARRTSSSPGTMREVYQLATGAFVWGGDGNHSLSGQEVVGSKAGRAAVQAFLDTRGLVAATRELPSRVEGVLSIDHIAAPIGWSATARHVVAAKGGVRLSDHDAYVVDLQG